jgi:hypothetical protein
LCFGFVSTLIVIALEKASLPCTIALPIAECRSRKGEAEASGSGKTIFLRCINHLERVDSGRIEVNGHLIGYRSGKNGELIEDSERNKKSLQIAESRRPDSNRGPLHYE